MRAASAMGSKKKKSKSKKSKRHVQEMHIRHAANGGYIVKHHYRQNASDPAEEPMDEHAVGDMGQLTQHVQDNMVPMQQPQQQQPIG